MARRGVVSLGSKTRKTGEKRMPVVGASPVTFISESTSPGKQYQIPLSQITITSGTASAAAWMTAVGLSGTDEATLVPALLASLLQQGLIAVPPSS